MHQLACKAVHRVRGQSRVGIERHHELDVGRHFLIRREVGRVLVTAQKQIELVQLAPLAFPTHPAVFLGIEETFAM